MSYSRKQQRAAGADLARVRAGKRPRVMKGATQAQLAEMASGPTKRPKAKPTMKHKAKLKRRT
ncbi:MAG TPA: hypothetical protein DCQ64_00950 [Candidatus Rokubacteria bacterium]|nr:hypothetical protein [Candidatus Rokubacteria bacterium]